MSDHSLKDVAGVRECCKDDGNLRVIASNATVTTRACVVCNAKHYMMTAEAGRIMVRGIGEAKQGV